MRIGIEGSGLRIVGEGNAVASAAEAALRNMGAVDAGGVPDLLLVSLPLLPADAEVRGTLEEAEAVAAAMRSGGRVVFLLPAAAGLPMRRHPGFSAAMAGAFATMRGMAMRLAPGVRVNAVGVGAVGDPLVAGDPAMLGHASLGRPGTVAEVTAAVLFLADPMNSYTTGQMLCVDGGWSAGYGRSF